jgi:hypothetical protein
MAAAYMTADEARLAQAADSNKPPGWGSYLAAVLVPFAGFVLAIRTLAKDKIGPGLALVLTAWLAMTIWSAIFFAVAYHRIDDALSSSDNTPALIDSTSIGTSDDPTTDSNIAGGGTGTFSADDTDGDGVNDDQDAHPYDAGRQ